MKAIRIHEFGDESVLRYEEVTGPQLTPREVLVKVNAASLNRGDLGRRAGTCAGGGEPLLFSEARRITGGRGMDVVLESVGGDILSRSLLAMAFRGRLVTVADRYRAERRNLGKVVLVP